MNTASGSMEFRTEEAELALKLPSLSLILAATGSIFFVATTIIGAIRWFSPVPFWDMWDGYIMFYLVVSNADWSQVLSHFLAQANEHRYVFARILFWLDLHYLGGRSLLMIPMNIALITSIWVALSFAARRMVGGSLGTLVALLIAELCFSWLQSENITWAYTSGWIATYLFPLLALISFALAIEAQHRAFLLSISIAFGIASLGTLANGILALPLLFVVAVLSGRATRAQLISLFCAAIIGIGAWFHNYQFSHNFTSIGDLARFALLFLGSPLAHIFHSQWPAYLGGALMIWAGAFSFYRWWRSAERDPMLLAMIGFLAYIGAASVAAASGRAWAGIGAALASRYTTPILLGWATMLIIFTSMYRKKIETRGALLVLSAAIPFVLLTSQLGSFSNDSLVQAAKRRLAALALDLDIQDDETTRFIYPIDKDHPPEHVHTIAKLAVASNLSVFSSAEMQDARTFIGRTSDSLGLDSCLGSIDLAETIETDRRYNRLTGWTFNQRTASVPKIAFLVAHGVVVGAALTGIDRPDVEQAISPSAVRAGFQGYATDTGGSVSIVCGG